MSEQSGHNSSRIVRFISLLEDSVLVVLLGIMLSTAVLQIFLRNFFDFGLSWADPMLRILVLWVGMVGAILASRQNNHISMNMLTHFLPEMAKRATRIVVNIFTFIVCSIVAYHSVRFVLMEYEESTIAFGIVPTWLCESIIPFTFTIIAIRYFIFTIWDIQLVLARRDAK